MRAKVVTITTDGASNFKCALKRHGDDYETYNQLMMDADDCDDELLNLDLEDLERMWGPAQEFMDINDDIVPLEFNATDQDIDVDSNDDEAEVFKVHEISDQVFRKVVDAAGSTEDTVLLPSRIDCCAHAFNSIGRTDSFNALKADKTYAARYVSVFKKFNAIWKANSTRLGRENFDYYLHGYKIQKPHRIRWNRIFEAVSLFHRICICTHHSH